MPPRTTRPRARDPRASALHLAAPTGEAPAQPSTRDAILDAAERLFAARGIDGVAVRDLARETDLTPSSLYNHFPGKQALYDAVLERGLKPIVEMMADAWRGGPIRREHVHARVDRLVTHLAAHPHLAPLLQRVLLEDAARPDPRLAAWVRSLSRAGLKLMREAAADAGWDPEEVPHLTLALFGMTYSYFINAASAHAMEPWRADPFSARALAVQRDFLEEAMMRLLGPRPHAAGRRRKVRK